MAALAAPSLLDTRAVLEPAGAVAIAGLKKYVDAMPGVASGSKGNFVAISSDASNIEFDILRFIAERAAIGEQREKLFSSPTIEWYRIADFQTVSLLQIARRLTAPAVARDLFIPGGPIEAFHGKTLLPAAQRVQTLLQKRAEMTSLFPNARQCGRCGFGPVELAGCDDLASHHGQVMSGSSVPIDNACRRCGWLAVFSPSC